MSGNKLLGFLKSESQAEQAGVLALTLLKLNAFLNLLASLLVGFGRGDYLMALVLDSVLSLGKLACRHELKTPCDKAAEFGFRFLRVRFYSVKEILLCCECTRATSHFRSYVNVK